MPTYDYECTKCSNTFEAFQQMSEKHLTKCPKCGEKLKRLIGSGSGIIFKGSGFYSTDYKKPGKASPSINTGNACPKEGCHGCKHSH
ncbi:MAG: zinc ribbon domain-containing protein [Candidatus Omnitrophica bacterium]|nr:zinc ribbon domain-containing protein [Candidatus Omnitrophota bacterium]